MTGRNLAGQRAREVVEPGEPLLAINDLHVGGAHGREAVRGVSLEVRAGEIVGIAGVSGNGQTELVEAIVGIREYLAGEITIGSTEASGLGVAARRRAGLAYVPEDRRAVGTAESASVGDNLAAGSHRAPPIARRGVMNPTFVREHADRLVEKYQIKVPSIDARASTLSGGNLQKLVIAREFEHLSEVVIAEQPTRGIDIGATEYIHRQLLDVREARRGVLLVSSELSEILALSDRVLVMFEGRIVGELDGRTATEEELGLLMAGHRPSGDGAE